MIKGEWIADNIYEFRVEPFILRHTLVEVDDKEMVEKHAIEKAIEHQQKVLKQLEEWNITYQK